MGDAAYVDMLVKECGSRGLKTAGNLTAILSTLADGDGHPDVEELPRTVGARGRRIALASVYRVVAQLTRIGKSEQSQMLADQQLRQAQFQRDVPNELRFVQATKNDAKGGLDRSAA